MEAKTKNPQGGEGFKPYEELEFSDDFMFGKVMLDSELCHDVLECLLGIPVDELKDVQNQKEYRYTKDGKPIRMDIYSQDSTTVYDSEMQNLPEKRSIDSLYLPKRSRFYQSAIDTDFMNAGEHYRDLPDSMVIFICTFDPFEKGLARYTFKNQCVEDQKLKLEDRTTKVFFNCCYEGNDIPEDVRNLYDYVTTGEIKDDLAKRINEAVIRARK